jgi:hypothetical protein
LPLNPQWARQRRVQNLGAIPDTGLYHNFSKSVTVGGSVVRVPDFSDCTDQTEEADEAEQKISGAISKLPLTQRRQVQNARAVTGVRPVLHPLPPTAAAQRIATLPAFPRIDERLGTSAGRATRKNERDAAQMRALCEATSNAPAGLPAEVCTAVVRDSP